VIVCLHGFMDSPRTWDLVLPRLGAALAPALPGHAGGPSLASIGGPGRLVDHLEAVLDDAGVEAAVLTGNSLGAYLALRLAERGRALSVAAFAPAGGWSDPAAAMREVFGTQRRIHAAVQGAVPEEVVATPAGRRRVTRYLTVRYEHIPADVLAAQVRAVAACDIEPLIEHAEREGWPLEPERIRCPVRFVWGTSDALLPWPSAAARYQALFPHADWVQLDDVGHAPQLDVPVETAELIRGL
jgi:pimeloyl-ACP methyl ester carboxylesterase